MLKIQVLMSVYNGAQYINQQLDSILEQKLPNNCQLSVLVRDDGSTDNGATFKILEEYSNEFDFVSVYKGDNLGACGSFFHLTAKADEQCDFYAFSDQDDVWLPNKLIRAIEALSQEICLLPAVYSTQIEIVDKNLLPIKGQKGKCVQKFSFGNAIVENVVTGCTAVFNKAMLDKLRLVTYAPKVKSEGLYLHDWTLYMIAMSCGKLVYDKQSSLLYRQHENNVLGAGTGILAGISRKYRLFLKFAKNKVILKNLTSFYDVYGELLSENARDLALAYLNKGASLRLRLKIVSSKEVFRQKKFDNLIYKIMILLNVL